MSTEGSIDISVIVVSYNTKKLLKDCVESILRSEGNSSLEIYVVDNNSIDDSVRMNLSILTNVWK